MTEKMEVLGPFPELDDHEYKTIILPNGMRVLLVSSERKDTAIRRATSHLDLEDRKAIAKLLRDAAGSSITKETPPKPRRSTLLTENGSMRNLYRASQNAQTRRSDLDEDSSPVASQRKSRTSQRFLDESTAAGAAKGSNRTSQRMMGEESNVYHAKSRLSQKYTPVSNDEATNNIKPNRTSARFTGLTQADESIVGENKRTSRRLEQLPDDEADDGVSVRSFVSHKSLPGNTSFRKARSKRMSSAVSATFQTAYISGVVEDSLPAITDVSAAAVCISVGSLSDPSDCQGLAHVVEHMVFMGNERFPSENDWDTFISKAGGDSNATTEAERTTYHFTAPQESFEDALARFAQFFHNPLLRKESMQRELSAIDSEFNDSAGEVSFRLAEVACSTARFGAFSQFACGNSKTLKSNPHLHSYVVEFFQKHYVAANMSLVLYSSDPITVLEEQALKFFGSVPSQREMSPHVTSSISRLVKFVPDSPPFRAFDENHEFINGKPPAPPGVDGYTLGCVVVCDPGGAHPHTLQMSWQLPCQRGNWQSKPLQYLSYLIGSETEGGILAELKQREWANNLFASDGTYASGIEGNSVSTLFSVYILLTDSGLFHWDSVVACVLEYLGMLAREGVQEWVFEELKLSLLAQYVFRDSADVSVMVESLCRRLCKDVSQIPPERVCNGEDLVFAWDPEAVQSILRLLVPETCRIDLVTHASGLSAGSRSNNNRDGSKAPEDVLGLTDRMFRKPLKRRVFDNLLRDSVLREEPWYQTKYCVVSTPRKILSKWRGAMQVSKTFAHLSPRNSYVTPPGSESITLRSQQHEHHVQSSKKREVVLGGRKGSVEATTTDGQLALVTMASSGRPYEAWPDRVWVKQSDLESPEETVEEVRKSTRSVPSKTPRDSLRSYPSRLLMHDPSIPYRMWYLQHGGFHTSRVTLVSLFKIRPSNQPLSPLDAGLLELLLVCLEDALAKERYLSSIAGVRIEMKPDSNGFRYILSGLRDSVKLLVERTMPVIFAMAKSGIKSLANLSLEAQLEVVRIRMANEDCSLKETLDGVLSPDQHHPLAKLAALEQATNIRTRLDAFAKEAILSCRGLGLIHGNVGPAEAIEIQARIVSCMPVVERASSIVSSWDSYFARQKTVNVPTPPRSSRRDSSLMGTTSVFVAPVPSSSVLVYFQFSFDDMVSTEVANSDLSSTISTTSSTSSSSVSSSSSMANATFREKSRRAKIMSQLISQLIKEPLFNVMRTKWQIAYHAHAASHRCGSTLGMTLEVSSSHVGTVEMVELVDQFIVLFVDSVLKPMSALDFNRHLRALELRKLQKDPSPGEEAKRFFDSTLDGVQTGFFDWNAEANEVDLVGSLTKEEVVDFVSKYVHPDSSVRRTLSLLIVGETEMVQSTKGSVRAGGTNHRSMRLMYSTDSGANIFREEDENEIDTREDASDVKSRVDAVSSALKGFFWLKPMSALRRIGYGAT